MILLVIQKNMSNNLIYSTALAKMFFDSQFFNLKKQGRVSKDHSVQRCFPFKQWHFILHYVKINYKVLFFIGLSNFVRVSNCS